jgi:hypothetical protein
MRFPAGARHGPMGRHHRGRRDRRGVSGSRYAPDPSCCSQDSSGLFAADADRLTRVKREAQILASLNHTNIAAIHGFEESDGVQALVLELVDGATLADRINNGAVLRHNALPIAKQLAEALEAAHEQGIVHRDLKPAARPSRSPCGVDARSLRPRRSPPPAPRVAAAGSSSIACPSPLSCAHLLKEDLVAASQQVIVPVAPRGAGANVVQNAASGAAELRGGSKNRARRIPTASTQGLRRTTRNCLV